MKTHVLKGTKREIADRLLHINGEIHEVIVVESEPPGGKSGSPIGDDLFAEMISLMVDGPDPDDSREAIYTPADGE